MVQMTRVAGMCRLRVRGTQTMRRPWCRGSLVSLVVAALVLSSASCYSAYDIDMENPWECTVQVSWWRIETPESVRSVSVAPRTQVRLRRAVSGSPYSTWRFRFRWTDGDSLVVEERLSSLMERKFRIKVPGGHCSAATGSGRRTSAMRSAMPAIAGIAPRRHARLHSARAWTGAHPEVGARAAPSHVAW
jgi:hypothetical protein